MRSLKSNSPAGPSPGNNKKRVSMSLYQELLAAILIANQAPVVEAVTHCASNMSVSFLHSSVDRKFIIHNLYVMYDDVVLFG